MAALVLLSIPTMTAWAQLVTNVTIYQDNFARTGALDGSAPDTVNLPGATWIACNVPSLNAQLQTDGSEIALTNTPGTTNGFYLNGFLPFTPQVGHIYTLSCKISALSGGNQPLAMGFAVNPLTNSPYAAINCGAGWMLVRGNGSAVQPMRFPGGSGSPAARTNALGNTTNTFTVVLDTTTGTGAARGWTYRFFTNSVQTDSYAVANANPTMIKYVGIGSDAAQGDFQQFTLTDVLMRQGTPTIVEQPQNRTAQVGQSATFWVGVTNDYPAASYQWMTNTTGGATNAVPGATNAIYATPALDSSYDGLNYSVVISNALGSTNSAPASLTVVSGPPTIYSATKTASPTSVVVMFSKAVDAATGLNAAYYSLTVNGAPSGISVLSASYGSSSNNVILTTSMLDTNAGYNLTVQNVRDLFGNAMTSNTVPLLPAGLVLYLRGDSGVVLDGNNNVVQWLDQTTNGNNAAQFVGVPSAGLLGAAARPATGVLNGQPSLDFGNLGTGANLLHFLQAPSTASLESMAGNTTMYAVANFATTGGNDLINKTWGNLPAPFDWDPAGKQNVQYGNGFNNAPANGTGAITAGNPYVLASMITLPPEPGTTTNYQFYLNGANDGSGAIRGVTGNPPAILDGGTPLWIGGRNDLQPTNPKMRGQIAEIMLFNVNLSAADRTNVDNYFGAKYFSNFAITTDLPSSTTSSNGFSVTYTFAASLGSFHGFSFQWQANGTNIIGANGSTFTTPLLAPGDNGDTFDVLVTLPDGSTTNSTTNTLTVLNVPPFVTSAGITMWSPSNMVVLFDIAVDPATATVAANYSLNNGATVLSAAIGDLPNKVVLTTSPLTWNSNPGFYALTVSNVKDAYGNTVVTASPSVGIYPNAALWIRADTGVTADGTGRVSQWNDMSGNANNLAQNTPAFQPLLTTNAAGDPVVRFTSISATNFMTAASAPSLALTGDMSIIAAITYARLNGGVDGDIVSKTGGTAFNIPAPFDYYAAPASVSFYRGNGASFSVVPATSGPPVGTPCIMAVSETGEIVNHYINGKPAGTGVLGIPETSTGDAGNPLSIGAREDLINRLTGDISELIVASTPLSSGEMTLLANYIATQHHFSVLNSSPTNIVLSSSGGNLTLSWPADHIGWLLQSNSVGLTATGEWFSVPGSATTNQITITPDTSKTNVFYRMSLQP
jgi:hypothetical protein